MRKPYWLLSSALVLLIPACNLPSTTATPTAAATATPFSGTPPPSVTPLASATSFPTESPTPSVPTVAPKDLPVNCRYGPGMVWEAVSGLLLGKTAEIVGKNSSFQWWYIKDPINSGEFCWVAMSATVASGNLASLPEMPPPTALVKSVSASASVEFSACGGPNPVTFSGSANTNGPTTITYQWEVSGDTTLNPGPETLEIDEAGAHSVPDPGALSLDCGNYTVRLHVLSPNEKSGKDDFEVGP